MQLRPGLEVRLQEAPYEDELLALVERGRLDFTFALFPAEGRSSSWSSCATPTCC